MKDKHIVLGKTNITVEEAARIARSVIKDETIMIRVDRRRKKEIESRAKRAGIPVSAYMLAMEDVTSRMKIVGAAPKKGKR